MISNRVKEISSFIVMDILERAHELEHQGISIIHLEIGEPDYDPAAVTRLHLAELLNARKIDRAVYDSVLDALRPPAAPTLERPVATSPKPVMDEVVVAELVSTPEPSASAPESPPAERF